ncbi:MAG: hypothetical protein GWP91_09165, partial [Rhodobacterales bacterium]|nr:hypothetical protein [Rhodobacterales bacterium]
MTVNSPRLWILLGLGLLLGPGCGDDDTDTDTTPVQVDPQWFYTCGDPACRDYEGPFDGVPMCEDLGKTEGDICTDGELTDTCDPAASCNSLLICATEDPTQKTGGCPISLAKHKKGIHYLSGEERQGASEDLLNMKLATW